MDKTFHIELNAEQMNVVLFALSKLPIDSGLQTFTSVQQQAQAQAQTPEGPLSDKVV